jgi:hypothetical protein
MPPNEQKEITGSANKPLGAPPSSVDAVESDTQRDSALADLSLQSNSLSFSSLWALASSRNCGQALSFIQGCTEELINTYQARPIPFSFNETQPIIDVAKTEQFGDVVYMPMMQGAKAYIISDWEGDVELVEQLFKKERILERLSRNKNDEQVFVISLGDAIDRGNDRASEALEFLLDLKFNRGFGDNIQLLTGNHERCADVQLNSRCGGFFKEVVEHRSSYSVPGAVPPNLQSAAVEWFESTFIEEFSPAATPHRLALWIEFNRLFSYSPKTIVTESGLVLCHGGPTNVGAFGFLRNPDEWPRPTFEQGIRWLTNIPFDTEQLTEEEREALEILHEATIDDITWSDWKANAQNTEPNLSRRFDKDKQPLPLGLYYNSNALEQYLSVLGARVMIRGHQKHPPAQAAVHNSNVWFAGSSLLTINSTVASNCWVDSDTGGVDEVLVTNRSYVEVDLGKPIRGIQDIIVHEL